jgi:DNA-binding PadR family transcriptional regulator
MEKQIFAQQKMNDNEYHVLVTLAIEPLYGYRICKEVEKKTQGRKKISLATLYDTLHRLARQGLIEENGYQQSEGGIRRTYRITDTGRQLLREEYSMRDILQSMNRPSIMGVET